MPTPARSGSNSRQPVGRWTSRAAHKVHASRPKRHEGGSIEAPKVTKQRLTRSAGQHAGGSLAIGSLPWLYHALNQRSGNLVVVCLAIIGLIVAGSCATKIIQVIYAQRTKIIAAKGKCEIDALQKKSEAEIAELRAVVHSLLLLSGKEEMVRAEVFNPDLPAERRMSDDHIIQALSLGDGSGRNGDQTTADPSGVVRKIS
jgi:hypothetical protein